MRCLLGSSSSLEVQAALAGGVGEGLDAAVVLVAAAVEDRGLDAGGLGALGEQRADAGGLLHLGEALEVALGPVDGGQRAAGDVVDELRGLSIDDVLGLSGREQASETITAEPVQEAVVEEAVVEEPPAAEEATE